MIQKTALSKGCHSRMLPA